MPVVAADLAEQFANTHAGGTASLDEAGDLERPSVKKGIVNHKPPPFASSRRGRQGGRFRFRGMAGGRGGIFQNLPEKG